MNPVRYGAAVKPAQQSCATVYRDSVPLCEIVAALITRYLVNMSGLANAMIHRAAIFAALASSTGRLVPSSSGGAVL